MGQIVAVIMALSKAVPAINSLLKNITEEYQKLQISQIEDKFEQRKKTRAFLTYQLKNARTDNERIAAFKLLSDIE